MPLVFINTYKESHWGYLSRDVHPWVPYAASFIIENGEESLPEFWKAMKQQHEWFAPFSSSHIVESQP